MSHSFLSFVSVTYRYPEAPSSLIIDLSVTFPAGWTGVVGPNGAGKGTLLGRITSGLRLPADRLISMPQEILASRRLSPGELRKVMLAIGIARVPWLIVLDEPTNHLDLPSIECLTEALAAGHSP